MTRRRRPIPTLTRVACPGETLRDHGLWLPLRDMPQATDSAQATDHDWSRAMPFELHHRSAALRDRVQARVERALQRFFETRETTRPRRF